MLRAVSAIRCTAVVSETTEAARCGQLFSAVLGGSDDEGLNVLK